MVSTLENMSSNWCLPFRSYILGSFWFSLRVWNSLLRQWEPRLPIVSSTLSCVVGPLSSQPPISAASSPGRDAFLAPPTIKHPDFENHTPSRAQMPALLCPANGFRSELLGKRPGLFWCCVFSKFENTRYSASESDSWFPFLAFLLLGHVNWTSDTTSLSLSFPL